MTSRLRS